jgi:hypothetical protein
MVASRAVAQACSVPVTLSIHARKPAQLVATLRTSSMWKGSALCCAPLLLSCAQVDCVGYIPIPHDSRQLQPCAIWMHSAVTRLCCSVRCLAQVDYVGYIPNPHYSRAKAAGAARKAALHLQHTRLKMAEEKANLEAARAARVQVSTSTACCSHVLPSTCQIMQEQLLAYCQRFIPQPIGRGWQRYKQLVIRAQSSMLTVDMLGRTKCHLPFVLLLNSCSTAWQRAAPCCRSATRGW